MAECCFASLPIHFASNNSSHRLLPIRPKPISRPAFSSSFPKLVLLINNKLPSVVVPFVARTSGWVGEESAEWNSGEVSEGETDVAVEEGSAGGEDEVSYPVLLEEAKLFVGNLPYDMDSEKLAHLFEGAGIVEVAEVTLLSPGHLPYRIWFDRD